VEVVLYNITQKHERGQCQLKGRG